MEKQQVLASIGEQGSEETEIKYTPEFLTCPARRRAPWDDRAAERSEVTLDFKHNEFEGFMIPPHGDVEWVFKYSSLDVKSFENSECVDNNGGRGHRGRRLGYGEERAED